MTVMGGGSSHHEHTAASDPRCPECGVPLRALVVVDGDRCADREACAMRKKLGAGHTNYLLTPEGVAEWSP